MRENLEIIRTGVREEAQIHIAKKAGFYYTLTKLVGRLHAIFKQKVLCFIPRLCKWTGKRGKEMFVE